jgi:hypothetical protein
MPTPVPSRTVAPRRHTDAGRHPGSRAGVWSDWQENCERLGGRCFGPVRFTDLMGGAGPGVGVLSAMVVVFAACLRDRVITLQG